MKPSTSSRYRLDYQGHVFEIESASAGLHTVARLFVDGALVDEQKRMDGSMQLQGGGLTVVVRLNWVGQITQILAVPIGVDPKQVDEEGMAFAAPAGSRAARLESLKRERPELYAARHVVVALLQVLVGGLGIGALLRGLLPRLSLPDIPWPDLPDVPWPDLPNLPIPDIDLPDVAIPDWIGTLWSSVNWLIPIVIAVVVAFNEVDKRRKRQRAATARRQAAERTLPCS